MPGDIKKASLSSNEGLDRLMGLVVSLRFLLWSVAVGVATGFLFFLSFYYSFALKAAVVPFIFTIYLLSTGHVLLLIRLYDKVVKLLAFAPLMSVALLVIPEIRTSVRLSAFVIAAGFWLYFEAIARQAEDLEQAKTASWFRRLRKLLGPTIVVILFLPDIAALVAMIAAPLFFIGTAVGWFFWLNELLSLIHI